MASALGLPQHANEHRPKRPVLLAVDQQLREGAALRVAPELADPVGPLEVGQHQGRGAARLEEQGRARPGAPGVGARVHRVASSVGPRCLLGDGLDRAIEDLALAARHTRHCGRVTTAGPSNPRRRVASRCHRSHRPDSSHGRSRHPSCYRDCRPRRRSGSPCWSGTRRGSSRCHRVDG